MLVLLHCVAYFFALVLPALAASELGFDQPVTKEWLVNLLERLPPSKPRLSHPIHHEHKETGEKKVFHFITPGPNHVNSYTPGFCNFVNELPISGAECEILIQESASSVNHVRLSNEDSSGYIFKCAIKKTPIDVSRLKELFDNEKHLHLDDSNKETIMNLIIYLLLESEEMFDENLFSAFSLLLDHGFASSIDNLDLNHVFSSQRIMEAVLMADPDVYKKNIKPSDWSVSLFIDDYDTVEMLFLLGVDATALCLGLTMLDDLYLSNCKCRLFLNGLSTKVPKSFKGGVTKYREHCQSLEDKRESLIFYLESKGLELSKSLKNFETALEKRLYAHAARVLLNANFGAQDQYSPYDSRVSPVSVALKSNHIGIIKLAFDQCLSILTKRQLKYAKSLVKRSSNPKVKKYLPSIKERLSSI